MFLLFVVLRLQHGCDAANPFFSPLVSFSLRYNYSFLLGEKINKRVHKLSNDRNKNNIRT